MELKDLLEYFRTSDTIGESAEAIELMRLYSREAQKITMEINTGLSPFFCTSKNC